MTSSIQIGRRLTPARDGEPRLEYTVLVDPTSGLPNSGKPEGARIVGALRPTNSCRPTSRRLPPRRRRWSGSRPHLEVRHRPVGMPWQRLVPSTPSHLIELNGDNLRRYPLEVRKATLASIFILAKASPGIRFNEHIEGDGPIRPCLQDGARRYRVEAEGFRLPFRPLARLAQNEERRCTGAEARRGGRTGQKEKAIALLYYFSRSMSSRARSILTLIQRSLRSLQFEGQLQSLLREISEHWSPRWRVIRKL